MATGALGIGINIEGIIYVVHVGRPYGLTSFMQQSGRGGQNGEVSDCIIITRVQNSIGWKRLELMSEHLVEQVDEDAMMEFILASTCRRIVLSRSFDKDYSADKEVDCISTGYCFVQPLQGEQSPGYPCPYEATTSAGAGRAARAIGRAQRQARSKTLLPRRYA